MSSIYPTKEIILSVINRGVSEEFLWKLEEVLACDLNERNQRAIVLMYQSKDFSLYLYDLRLKLNEWEIESLIPLDWNFAKIGYSIFLSEEVKELIKENGEFNRE